MNDPKVFLVLCSGSDDYPGNENGISTDESLSLDELRMMVAMATDMARLHPSPVQLALAKKLDVLLKDILRSAEFVH